MSIKKQSSSAGGSLETTQLGKLYINNNTLLYVQIVEIAILHTSVPYISLFSLSLSLSAAKPQIKRRGCMECAGCKREDCGTCRNCKDMVKFGGPGRKKQKCALRVCLTYQSNKTALTKKV